MKKNKMGRYTEDGHNDYEETIDLDSGESVPDAFDEEKELNRKIKNNLEILGGQRGKPFHDLPTQIKHYKMCLSAGYTHKIITDTFVSLLESEYWIKQKKENSMLPDFKTVYSNLKNKL